MNTDRDLHQMDERDLISEVLKLRTIIANRAITEEKCSQIHNYHFASNEIFKLDMKNYFGSAVILGGIYDLKGKLLVMPITISDGLSDNTINGLLDDIQRTYDHKIEFKPTKERK